MKKELNYIGLGLGVFIGGVIGIFLSNFLGKDLAILQGAVSSTCMFIFGFMGSRLKN